LVHHSDAGSQYVSVAFTAELLEAGIAGSIGTIGDALDNAPCQSTIGLFKTEAINLTGPAWTTGATSSGKSPAGSTGHDMQVIRCSVISAVREGSPH